MHHIIRKSSLKKSSKMKNWYGSIIHQRMQIGMMLQIQ